MLEWIQICLHLHPRAAAAHSTPTRLCGTHSFTMRLSINSLILALIVSAIAACAPSSSAQEGEASPQAKITMRSLEGASVIAQGSFSGENDHVVTGTVQIVELEGQTYLRLDDTFTLDGAPDPKVGFGRSGKYDTATTISPLRNHSGAQDYPLPAGFQLGSLNEAYIWCEQFSVSLGVAKLQL